MLPTTITKMNEESTNQNPQKYCSTLDKSGDFILFTTFKFTMMGVCTFVHQQILKQSSKLVALNLNLIFFCH